MNDSEQQSYFQDAETSLNEMQEVVNVDGMWWRRAYLGTVSVSSAMEHRPSSETKSKSLNIDETATPGLADGNPSTQSSPDTPEEAGLETDQPREERRWAPGQLRKVLGMVAAALQENGINPALLLAPRQREMLPLLLDESLNNINIGQQLGFGTQDTRNLSTEVSHEAGRILDRLIRSAPPEALPEIPEPAGPHINIERANAGAQANELLRRAGITQQELADMLSESLSSVQRVLAGMVHPSATKMLAILRAARATPEELSSIMELYRQERQAKQQEAHEKRRRHPQ